MNNTTQHPSNHAMPSAQRGYIGELPASHSSTPGHDMMAGALDELACGVIIVDRSAQVLHCNTAAQAVIARGDCVGVQDHKLVTSHPTDTQSLQEALTKAAQGKRSMIALGPLARTTVAVVPLKTVPNAAPRFALMFSRAGVCESLMLSFFSRAHKLTATEEQVLGLMCIGLTAPEMAQRLMVGEATIRTHVRNICAKTNSSGIREVIKRLAVLPPLMAAVMPSGLISA